MKYLTNSGLSYFFNKIKAYLTSNTYLNSIGISNSEIDNIADNEGYSSGSLPASEDVFLTGDIIPNTDNSVDLGASSKNIKMIYTKGITINGTQFLPSDYIPKAGGAVITGGHLGKTANDSSLLFAGGTGWDYGAGVSLYGKDSTINAGYCLIRAYDATDDTILSIQPRGTIAKVTNGTTKNVAMYEDVIPRSGGAVMTGALSKVNDTSIFTLMGGTAGNMGALINLYGKNEGTSLAGAFLFQAYNDVDGNYRYFVGYPNGTLTWFGQPIQYGSDQRLKQQITEIDTKLLDAWEDVDLVQFKYNDAVNEKGDNARLHTGYVVQQINEACQKHNIDISAYGLYCHEEYPERTEEVEVKQDDGSVIKETKVLEPAKEYYSLRYTEALIVECAYLRKRIKELEERLEKLELQ